jgi:16S rRNA processing protein RimM
MQFKTSQPLGRVLKTHGRQGELIISCEQGFPVNFKKMESLFIEINEQVVPFFLEHVIEKTPTTAIIKLEDVDNLEEAGGLTGLTWFLPVGAMEQEESGAPVSLRQLEGYRVIDQQDQEIGVVEGYQEIPSNPLLEVRRGDDLVHIPVNGETLYYIDQEKKVIKNEIPEGLLDL